MTKESPVIVTVQNLKFKLLCFEEVGKINIGQQGIVTPKLVITQFEGQLTKSIGTPINKLRGNKSALKADDHSVG